MPALNPVRVTVATPFVPLGVRVGFVIVESTVTATVPPGALVPDVAATVTVKVTSVPVAL